MANLKAIFARTPNKVRDESGQALVEFALVLMFVILPFTFVLVDGAVTLYTQAALTNAVREGARAGSIYQAAAAPAGTFDQQWAAIDVARTTYVQQEVQRMVGPLVAFSDCTMTIAYSPAAPELGNPYRELDALTIALSCPRQLFFGLIGASQITLEAEATMRLEPGGVAPNP